MKSLLYWYDRAVLDNDSPLIMAPVFHYRFVTIHPFMDGNGRVACLFTNFILYSHGYDISKYAAIEKQHEIKKAEYYIALRQLQGDNFYDIPGGIDITSWIFYWLKCLKLCYEEALLRVRKIERKNDLLELDGRLRKAVNLFNRHKRLSASDYMTLTGLGRTQAVDDLNKLVKLNRIQRVGGGRSTVYKMKE